LIHRWSAPGRAWTDMHRLALACGALLVSTLVGFFFVTASNPIDQLGVGASAVVAAILVILFIRRLQRRSQRAPEPRQRIANNMSEWLATVFVLGGGCGGEAGYPLGVGTRPPPNPHLGRLGGAFPAKSVWLSTKAPLRAGVGYWVLESWRCKAQ